MPEQGTWLECNGQSTAGHPALAVIVGANVPDYRGIFLRGFGSHVSTHYGSIAHSSAALGALQGDAIRNITGTVGNFVGGTAAISGSLELKQVSNLNLAGDVRRTITQLSLDVSKQVPTDTENRPINKAVRYLIKAA